MSLIFNIKFIITLFLYDIELSRLVKKFETDEDSEQVQNINDCNLILLNNYQKNNFQSRKNEYGDNYFNDNPLEKYLT